MSLPAGKKLDIVSFADMSGGVNTNDPAVSLRSNECADALNAKFLKKGFGRWPGCSAITPKGEIAGMLRGMWHHTEVDGTAHTYAMYGGNLYEIDRATGAKTLLYAVGGDGEAWGVSQKGTFFCANGTDVVKVEGSTAYKVGIAPPVLSGGAVFANGGGALTVGVYTFRFGYARRIGSVDVLYSTGVEYSYDLTQAHYDANNRSILLGIGFAPAWWPASTDPQATVRVVWMTGPDDSTLYLQKTSTTDDDIVISSTVPENSAITYNAYAAINARPGAFTYLFAFDNRLWGVIDNKVYYSQKGATVYDYEIWKPTNTISYPYRTSGLFSVGPHLCINTEENGVIIQPNADVSARFEHFEQTTSFKYMRTVDDWNGSKIGVTRDRVGVFSKESFTFEPWDYAYNVRNIIDRMRDSVTSNAIPCGIVSRRENRIEYLLSCIDPKVNKNTNSRILALNLSRTGFLDIDNYKTPWEIVGRGFNYVLKNENSVLNFGQNGIDDATIYKERVDNSNQIGIYDDNGIYIDTAAPMPMFVISKTVQKDMFTKAIIENIRALIRTLAESAMLITIMDDPAATIEQDTAIGNAGVSLWDAFNWGENWTNTNLSQYEYKGDVGVHGYTWNLKFSQTADDIGLEISQFDVLITLETGRGI